jgi:hypothetical protein
VKQLSLYCNSCRFTCLEDTCNECNKVLTYIFHEWPFYVLQIPLISHAWDWIGAGLSGIMDYQMVPIVAKFSQANCCYCSYTWANFVSFNVKGLLHYPFMQYVIVIVPVSLYCTERYNSVWSHNLHFMPHNYY